jgi:hypothetical protein
VEKMLARGYPGLGPYPTTTGPSDWEPDAEVTEPHPGHFEDLARPKKKLQGRSPLGFRKTKVAKKKGKATKGR